ncbi:MAG: hypothetical protein MK226_17235 [Saprospiraceae bacterium]|nr:hypothetical protein [Saprospiraceae bacterium]
MIRLTILFIAVSLPFFGFGQNFDVSKYDTIIPATIDWIGADEVESVPVYWTIRKKRWGMVDATGKTLLPNVYNYPIFNIVNEWEWESQDCNFDFEAPVLLKRENNYELIQPLSNKNLFPTSSKLIAVEHESVEEWHFLIQLADGSYTYLDRWGFSSFKAKSEIPPYRLQSNKVFIQQNGKLAISDEEGNVLIPPDSLHQNILIGCLDEYYKNGGVFEERDSSLNLQELINLNIIAQNQMDKQKLDAVFVPTDMEWTQNAILSAISEPEESEFSYYFCDNDVCIRELAEKFQTDGEDYNCWPPGYGTFINHYYYARKLSEHIYEINREEETYGHGSGIEPKFNYFKRQGLKLIKLKRSDFFIENDNLNNRLTELARKYYEYTDEDNNLDRENIVIDDDTNISFGKKGFQFILPVDGWNYYGGSGLIPYEACPDIIPQNGIIEKLRKSPYLKE